MICKFDTNGLVNYGVWQKNTDDSTEIGFSVLHSPDLRKFDSYVEKLIEEKHEIESEQELLDGIDL